MMLNGTIRTLLSGAIGWSILLAGPVALGDEAGFTPIFDGESLRGWDGDPAHWRVEDGTIAGQTTEAGQLKHNTFLIWRQGELDDFELKFEYRIVGGNSGVQYRSWEEPEVAKWVVAGYQADFEAGDRWSGILYEERARAILAERGQKVVIGENQEKKVTAQLGDAGELGATIRKLDWNAYHVICRGYHLIHKINGHVMVDVTDEDRQNRRRSGILAFQLHAGPPMKIQVRNVQLKRLPMEGAKKIVLLAGPPSHGYGEHEHNAGCLLLAGALNEHMPGVHAVVYRNGWPDDPTAFDNADAIVMYADGAQRHPVIPHLDEMNRLMQRGVGLVCIHYAVEVPKGDPGNRFLDWIGGHFELDWSVNPHWVAEFKKLPDHPITRGVEPFSIKDEWYYHMRFRRDMQGVTPVLTAIPPAETLDRPDGPRSGNPEVRAAKGQPQHVAWAYERRGGGRGFGFTGAHYHWNWGHDGFRKLMLNAIVWSAGGEVPPDGVTSITPTREALEAHLDEPRPAERSK